MAIFSKLNFHFSQRFVNPLIFRRLASRFPHFSKPSSLGLGLGIGFGAFCLTVLGFSPNGVIDARSAEVRESLLDNKDSLKRSEDLFTSKSTHNVELPLLVRSKVEALVASDNRYEEAITQSRDLIQRVKDEYGAPGIVIGVSVDGKNVWEEGLGYADVENRVPCTKDTVLRIASISKSITMAALAKLWEKGVLDLDKPIQEYVPHFPEKTVDGEKVVITTRLLVSHLSGIRHYDKSYMKQESAQGKQAEEKDSRLKLFDRTKAEKKDNADLKKKDEFSFKEYYIKEKFDSVKSSLDLFKDDPLVHKPGTKFLYTTHGWTLISAVIEAVSKESFTKHMTKFFKDLDMTSSYLDVNDAIIYHRSRNYCKDKSGKLNNTPYVDNSYKWAGGGFLSTVGDLLKFGNVMLYSYQCPDTYALESMKASSDNSQATQLPGYLKRKTIDMLWTPVDKTEMGWDRDGQYGMGWGVVPQKQDCGHCREQRFYVSHTGGAIGASSVLLIMPDKSVSKSPNTATDIPKGIVVTIITNLETVSLNRVALKIAKLFEEAVV